MKLSGDIKLPKLRRSGGDGAAKPAGRGIQAPPFVENTYRDLRDRRLLLPVALLLLALVAVPVLLSKDAEPAPPPVAADMTDEAAAVQPAVMTEQLDGVRDYRKRLDALSEKNPFKQQYVVPPATEQSVESVGATDSTLDEPASFGGGGGGSVTAPSSLGGSTSPADPGGSSASPPAPKTETKVVVYEGRADVVVTHEGRRVKIDDVSRGRLLPDRETPVVMFLDATSRYTVARFAVSRKVTATDGDGHCAPANRDCVFLRLKAGERRVFTYGPDAERYVIKVTDVRRHQVRAR